MTKPCGTPESTGRLWETLFSTKACCHLLCRKSLIHVVMYGFTPMCFSLWTSLWWSTLSNALLKSMTMTSVCWPWSKLSAISWVKPMSWVSQLCFDLNPCCWGQSIYSISYVVSVKIHVIHHVWHNDVFNLDGKLVHLLIFHVFAVICFSTII